MCGALGATRSAHPCRSRRALPGRGRHPPCHGGAPLGTLDRFGGDGWGDVVGLVLGLRLERQEAAQLALDLGAIRASLTEESEDLVVVLAGGSLAEASAADGVGGVDPGVDGEARG